MKTLAPIVLLVLAACSQQTQDAAQETVENAAADTAANAAVAGEVIQDGAVVAADQISEGAADLRDEMADKDDTAAPAAGAE